MQLNQEKCKVMHMGYHNQNYEYYLKDASNTPYLIQSTECEKDLGVMLQSNLKWHNQVKYVCQSKQNHRYVKPYFYISKCKNGKPIV